METKSPSLRVSLFGLLGRTALFAALPFLTYYAALAGMYMANDLHSVVTTGQHLAVSFSFSLPEHWLWYAASLCLAGLAVVTCIFNEFARHWSVHG